MAGHSVPSLPKGHSKRSGKLKNQYVLYCENMKAKMVQNQISTVFAGWPNPAVHPSHKDVEIAPNLTYNIHPFKNIS